MKLKAILLFILITVKADVFAQPSIRVFFEQDSIKQELLHNDSTIQLKGKPFTIEVHMINESSLFLNVSFDTLFYYSIPANKNFKDWKYIVHKSIIENPFNEDKNLFITEEFIHNWFYDSTLDWYRFDKGVQVKGDTIIARRTVEEFNNYDDDMSSRPIYTVRQPLYFVFFITDWTKETGHIETQRKKTIIELIH